DAGAGFAPARIVEMLATSARRASRSLGIELGKLTIGSAADVVVTDYVPFTPLTTANAAGHLIFAMASRNVRHVIAAGKIALRDRKVSACDEEKIRRDAVRISQDLWKRMEQIKA